MKARSRKSLIALSILSLLGTTMIAACSDSKSADSKELSPSPAASVAPTAGAASPSAQPAGKYPLKTDVTITHWFPANGALLAVQPDVQKWPVFADLTKKTGVNVKYVIPAVNQLKEQLNVMFASGEYTDIIENNFLADYPGGPEKAIKDGNILRLNDLLPKYAPNLMKYLKEHPEVDKQIKTDNGSYYGFPFIRGDDSLKTFGGPIIRKDWLDELGLAVPETIDEWYVVLKAFKEKKGATAPLTFWSVPRLFDGLATGAFIGAFGVKRDFYMENGKVKFGPAEPGYKDFLATMRKWYAEGLIDKDIATVDGKIQLANMTSGKSGATYGNAGGGIGAFMNAMKDKDPKYKVIGAPYPVLKKGETPKFGQKDFAAPWGGNHAISPKSKHPELVVQFLDYGYSEEGSKYFNFGTEGAAHTMVNGYPTYTEAVRKDFAVNMGLYTRAQGGPMIQDKRYYEQFAGLQEQKDAVNTWKKTDVDKYQLPPASATPEESSNLAKIMTEVNTLVDETTIRIVLGTEPLESYDKFLERLKSLKIDKAIEIQQAALDRYNKR